MSIETLTSFGLWVRERRRALGLTQDDLARRTHCSLSAIRKIEADERRPSPEVAKLLAQALEIAPPEQPIFLRVARQELRVERLAAVTPLPWTPVPQGAATTPAAALPKIQSGGVGQGHQLPVALTSFIGREQDLAAIYDCLAQPAPATRLLTLTGPGGSGKTRLALQAAARLAGVAHDGLWWVELGGVMDAGLLPHVVAAAIGVKETPPAPVETTVLEFLRPRRSLLVLDNCEHLVQACAASASWLLSQCPHLRILATSREPLQILGEAVLVVAPLALPAPDHELPLEELAAVESVRLLVERAQAARRDFAITAANRAAIVEICRRLDGIPLALELAASRLRAMTADQLAARLGDRFRVLTGGSRTALPRQQTLHALITWSHDLLSPAEQVLFRRLAVFAGGWSLEAAEAIAAVPPLDPDDLLDLLSSLVDKSLVTAREDSGVMRYQYLETIREYAGGQLQAADEWDDLHARYAGYCASLAAAAREALFEGGNPLTWIAQLQYEQENLRAALEWSLERQPAMAVYLAGCLAPLWNDSDQVAEGHGWLTRALDAGWTVATLQARAWATSGLGTMVWRLSDFPRAVALHEESLAHFRLLDDRFGQAFALNNIGVQFWMQEDCLLALRYYREGLAIARQIANTYLIAIILTNIGLALMERSELDEARTCFTEALATARALENPHMIGSLLHNLGELISSQGDQAGARSYFEQSYAQYSQIGSRFGQALNRWGQGASFCQQGDYGAALVALREALPALAESGSKRHVVDCLEWLGVTLSHLGATVPAVHLLGAAEAIRQQTNYQNHVSVGPARLEQTCDALRLQLGDAGFTTAWAAGLAMSLDATVEYALAVAP